MKAARLHALRQPLRIDEVTTPVVARDEVLIRIAGAGVCHSDLHIRSGEFPLPPGFDLPLTLGHENAGYVEAVGPDVASIRRGDAVAVWGGRGCGSCRICRQGDEQCCTMALWVASAESRSPTSASRSLARCVISAHYRVTDAPSRTCGEG